MAKKSVTEEIIISDDKLVVENRTIYPTGFRNIDTNIANRVFDEVTDDSAKLAKIKPMFYGDGLDESDALRNTKTATEFFNTAKFDVAKKQLVVKKNKKD